ncbi:MAG: hypothetical protein LBJ24_05555 [Treponema sp.]|jgi:hypothetical protein|nr:hypothetical protein [Treponema sp.]
MAHKHDYVPARDADFDKWFIFLVQYVNAKCLDSTWTHIPQAARTELTGARNAWTTAWTNVQGPHTKVDTEAKNDAKKAAKAVVRPFVNQYLRYEPVTDEDRTAMGIPNHDTIRTPIGRPGTIPVFTTEVRGIRSITLPFHEEGAKSHAIPYGFDGAVVSWEVSDTPVTDPKKLTRSELATSTPHTLHFEEADRGRTVYIALQWQNEKGEKGDFSAIQTAIVP